MEDPNSHLQQKIPESEVANVQPVAQAESAAESEIVVDQPQIELTPAVIEEKHESEELQAPLEIKSIPESNDELPTADSRELISDANQEGSQASLADIITKSSRPATAALTAEKNSETNPAVADPEATLAAATTPAPTKDDPILLKGFYPQKVDPTRYQLAFGKKGVSKLISEINAGSAQTDIKNMVILANIIHTPEDAYDAIRAGALKKANAMLESKNLTIRQKAAEIITILASHAQGRSALAASTVFVKLASMLEDDDALVRRFIHQSLYNLTIQRSCIATILSQGIFTKIIQLLPTERMDIQIPMLQTCQNVIRHGGASMPKAALSCGALETFFELLRDHTLVSEIKVAASNCIMMLSFYLETKRIAASRENLVVLTTLLDDRKSEVRAAVLGALMSITVDVEAKKALSAEKIVLPHLVRLLEDSNEAVIINCIKTITNCAEDYKGRSQLNSCVDKLRKHTKSKNDQLAQAADIAVRVITWRP